MVDDSLRDRVREIVGRDGRLALETGIDDDDDLYQAGLTSHATVAIMLSLEDSFDVEFPESKLRRRTFSSIATLSETIEELVAETDPENGPAATTLEGQG